MAIRTRQLAAFSNTGTFSSTAFTCPAGQRAAIKWLVATSSLNPLATLTVTLLTVGGVTVTLLNPVAPTRLQPYYLAPAYVVLEAGDQLKLIASGTGSQVSSIHAGGMLFDL